MDFRDFSLMIKDTKIAAFATSLAEGRLMATRCAKCSQECYPPQADCPVCLSQDMDWFELPSEGELLTFTQIMVQPERFAIPDLVIPFGKASLNPAVVGLVEVAGKHRVMGWVPKVSPEQLRIGERMTVNPQVLDDGRITIVLQQS